MFDKSGRRIAQRFAVRNFSEKRHFPSDLQSRVGVEKWLLNACLGISFRGLICCNQYGIFGRKIGMGTVFHLRKKNINQCTQFLFCVKSFKTYPCEFSYAGSKLIDHTGSCYKQDTLSALLGCPFQQKLPFACNSIIEVAEKKKIDSLFINQNFLKLLFMQISLRMLTFAIAAA